LAAAGVLLAQMPVRLAKRLPRYPVVPVARLGRLAVAGACMAVNSAAALLWDAGRPCEPGPRLPFTRLIVDAKG